MTATPTTPRLQKVHAKIAAAWDKLTNLSHKWQPWPTFALGSFFLGNVAARIWHSAGKFLVEEATVGWITAIATFSAAFAALHVAKKTSTENRQREQFRGALLAARTRMIWPEVEQHLRKVQAKLTQTSLADEDVLDFVSNRYLEVQKILAALDHGVIYEGNPMLGAHLVDLAGRIDAALIIPNEGQTKRDARANLAQINPDFQVLARNAQRLASTAFAQHVNPLIPGGLAAAQRGEAMRVASNNGGQP